MSARPVEVRRHTGQVRLGLVPEVSSVWGKYADASARPDSQASILVPPERVLAMGAAPPGLPQDKSVTYGMRLRTVLLKSRSRLLGKLGVSTIDRSTVHDLDACAQCPTRLTRSGRTAH